MMLVLGLVAGSFALDPILIGNFEDGSTGSGAEMRWDNWMNGFTTTEAVTVPIAAATRGSHSLKCIDDDGGWGANITLPLFEYGNTVESNPMLEALLNDGAVLSIDVTAISGEVGEGWCEMSLFYNMDATDGWGFDDELWMDLVIDGQAHTYDFVITDSIKNKIQEAIDKSGWGVNFGVGINAGAASTTIYVDNIWIFPDGPVDTYGPYGASAEQDFNAGDPDYVDFMLYWKAGQDPGGREPDPNFAYPVNPDIVDEYVFKSNSSTDPNLYYLGATGVDPGLYDPNSEYGPVLLPINKIYSWTVVEAMDGFEQTLTPGVSTLDDVDPNNIIGPKWTFATLSTTPVIDTQPVDARFGVDDASVTFTIAVTSNTTPLYQWYYSKDAVIDDGDNAIASGTTDTFTITSHNKAYQAYFYCRVANQATESGGGMEPDVYSDVVSLVVERKVAEYLFDGDLNDTSGEGNNGSGVGSPSYAAGVGGGSALSLDGSTQYVEIGSFDTADPNIFNNDCFPRADLLAADGVGGGLDVGTIMCWVKLDATAADQVSPILFNANGGWPHTAFQFDVTTDSAAANTNLLTAIWGDDEVLTMIDVNPVWADPFTIGGDGQWHMLAAAWDRNVGTMKAYLDGNILATWGADLSVFSAWDSTMTIGFNDADYFGGLIDNLRVYNYEVAAEDIAQEYYDVTGNPGCINDFAGSNMNSSQLGSSYCRLDLADFAVLAENWLNDGFYPDI